MGFTFTTIVIAALAGYGAYSFWGKNQFVGLIFAAVSGISAIIAFFALLSMTLALAFKLLPLIIVGLVAWFIYRSINNRKNAESSQMGAHDFE